MKYFISAIGTDSGKTLFSAILVEALQADYWKPIQAGNPTDTNTVKSLVTNPISTFYPEQYALKLAASPHSAAADEEVEIRLDDLKLPVSNRPLVIEGAGGLMVPLNDNDLMVDLPRLWNLPVVLVANLYLGSINHTLLSVEALERRGIEVKGIVFNGPSNPDSEAIILRHSNYKVLMRIPELEQVSKEAIKELAKELLNNWNE